MIGKLRKKIFLSSRIPDEIESRIQLGVQQAMAFAATRVEEVSKKNEKMLQHLPGVLNATATVPALANMLKTYREELKSVRGTLDHLESQWNREVDQSNISREVGNGFSVGIPFPRARIINGTLIKFPSKDGIKVNLGCGHIPIAGYINVDRRELPDVDIIADVAELPFDTGTLSEVFLAHVLEYFPENKLKMLLRYWKALLKKGGAIRAIVRDGDAMMAEFSSGCYSFEDFRRLAYGDQEYDGDFRYNMFTLDNLSVLLNEAGFSNIEILAKARKNGTSYEFEIAATA